MAADGNGEVRAGRGRDRDSVPAGGCAYAGELTDCYFSFVS